MATKTEVNLEGEYFVFLYSSDYADEQGDDCEALAVLQVENGKLVERLNPCDLSLNVIGEIESERIIEYLKEKGIRVVYSTHIEPVSCGGELYGLLLPGEYDDEDGWRRYDGIYGDRDYSNAWEERLEEEGIEVKLVEWREVD